ncbi:hypothetical protein [Phormidium nigroviride]
MGRKAWQGKATFYLTTEYIRTGCCLAIASYHVRLNTCHCEQSEAIA